MAKLQSTKAIDAKETIYVDVDDEITGIIDKVRSSKAKVVALVLPKRATVFQSIVNMKLLKRTAETAKKHLVLVTTEAGLLPLAGSVGLHVASTPTSKPTVPPAPETPDDGPEDVEEPLVVTDGTSDDADNADDSDFNAETASRTPVGELAAAGAAGAVAASKLKAPVSAIDEEINMDDSGEPTSAAADKSAKSAKAKKDRKLAVPNFDSFRNKLLIGAGVLVLLIVGWIFAFVVLPKATVTIHTDTSTVSTNVNLTLDTTAKTLNVDQGIVPATAQTSEKSYTQQVAATGQQNNGEKATGKVTFSAGSCSANFPADVPAGTGVSSGGKTYITQEGASFSAANSGGKCVFKSGSTNIVASGGGTSFNTGDSASFAVNGRADVSGTGSASGGTDNITKVVAQADIDSAKSKINTQDSSGVRSGLQAALQGKQLTAVTVTYLAGEPTVTASAKAGDVADSVTVTEVISYSMLGVKESDLKAVVVANVNKEIDKSKQVILDDGVAKAKFTQSNPGSATAASVAFSAKSIAGPDIDTNALREQVAGKKSGEIKSQLGALPGVTSVEVSYSPFWVHSTPKNVSKITVQIDKANTGKQ
ncbi:hypothetical protein EYC59_02380 [Candidatus Saccharibacteria bacterium]|nr:MAG: hypothetical protein EYC59_02380 [Candidatus Saccharibacteria bacterium]